jgi:hypothetical protein
MLRVCGLHVLASLFSGLYPSGPLNGCVTRKGRLAQLPVGHCQPTFQLAVALHLDLKFMPWAHLLSIVLIRLSFLPAVSAL